MIFHNCPTIQRHFKCSVDMWILFVLVCGRCIFNKQGDEAHQHFIWIHTKHGVKKILKIRPINFTDSTENGRKIYAQYEYTNMDVKAKL